MLECVSYFDAEREYGYMYYASLKDNKVPRVAGGQSRCHVSLLCS